MLSQVRAELCRTPVTPGLYDQAVPAMQYILNYVTFVLWSNLFQLHLNFSYFTKEQESQQNENKSLSLASLCDGREFKIYIRSSLIIG